MGPGIPRCANFKFADSGIYRPPGRFPPNCEPPRLPPPPGLPDFENPPGLEVTPLKVDRTVYACDSKNDIVALDAETGKHMRTLEGHSSYVNSVAISSDGKYLFSANGPSNDVSVVDLASSKEVARVKAGESPWGITIVQ